MFTAVIAALFNLEGAALHSLQLTILLTVSLLLWRIWRFTLTPMLKPNEPKELPYWIPFLGYAIPFFNDSEATLSYARYDELLFGVFSDYNQANLNRLHFASQYFGNTREPFTLTIAGQKLYIIMSPKDHSTIYKNSATLTFDGFIRDLYKTFGMSKDGIKKMWQAQSSAFQDKSKHVHLGQGIHREQLHPGSHLEDLTEVYLREIERRLRWDRIPDITSNGETKKAVSLYEWCAEVLGNATIQAFFGNALLDLEPRLLEHFYTFDSESYANANPLKVSFWLLCHILYDPDLLDTVRKEVEPSITGTKIDLERLLDNSPTLDAAFYETLRVTSINSSARTIEAPVIIGNKTLDVHGKILMPYRQLHLEEQVFGPKTKTFDHKRFLEKKDLNHSPSFKPFGGGSTLCSGRFIVKREILAFIALAVHRYDFVLSNSDQPFPRMDETKPTLGIMDPVTEDKIVILVSPRV